MYCCCNQGERLVLDAQNGYAFALQSSTGHFFDTLGSFDLHLEASHYLARDPLGRLLVSHPGDDYAAWHSVRVLDAEANLLFEFGETGTDPGQFIDPTGVVAWNAPGALYSGFSRILVADSANDRLQAFTSDGDFVTAYAEGLDDPQGLAVLDDGVVVAVDRGNARLRLFDFDGEIFTSTQEITADFVAPTHIAAYGPYLVVADEGTHTLKVLHRNGALVDIYTGPNEADGDLFLMPHGIAIDLSRRIIVADTGNRRVVTLSGALPALPPTELALTGPHFGQSGIPCTFTAAVTPLTATLPLTYTWVAAGQATIARTVVAYTDTMSYTWPTTDTYGVTVTVANDGGDITAGHTIVINPEFSIYLPLALRLYPPGPHITAFYADVEIADPSQTVLLTWASYGATGGTLYHLLSTGQFGSSWEVEPSGSMLYTIPTTRRDSDNFWLYVYDEASNGDSASLSIPLTCPYTWFFEPAPDQCPTSSPLYTAAN